LDCRLDCSGRDCFVKGLALQKIRNHLKLPQKNLELLTYLVNGHALVLTRKQTIRSFAESFP